MQKNRGIHLNSLQRVRDHPVPGHQWLFCIGMAIGALLMTYWPDGLLLFRYERSAFEAGGTGEQWRIVTGHWVHLNGAHLMFNVLGLFLLSALLWTGQTVLRVMGLIVVSSLGVSLLLYFFHPALLWYAGLSGVLHGIWAGWALDGTWLQSGRVHAVPHATATGTEQQAGKRGVCLIALLLLILKLLIEWRYGPSQSTEQFIGAPVVTAAHGYGALIGGAYAAVWQMATILRSKNNS